MLHWLALLLPTLVLLFLSALVSGAESAFFSLSPNDIDTIKSQKRRSHQLVLELLLEPSSLLATIVVLNNFINVTLILWTSYSLYALFPVQTYSPWLLFVLEIFVVGSLILIGGEILPKIYALLVPVPFARKTVYVIYPVRKILRGTGILSLFVFLQDFVEKYLKNKVHDTVDYLEQALKITLDQEDKTVQSQEERKILQGIVRFGQTEVKQVMSARAQMVSLSIETPFDMLLEKIIEHGYSRIPVYKENLDHIAGVIYAKDVLPYVHEKSDFHWQNLLRKPFFVPENKKLDDLLREFQESKVHLALVVDEYGGTQGVITLEDIIEEIVGDISDEFDVEEVKYTKLGENMYLFDGATLLLDIYRILSVDDAVFDAHRGEAETLAGFILELTGKIPAKNQEIIFNKFSFVIESADEKRIKQIRVKVL
jgi:gliding motility-associated protein GldE